MTTAEEDQNRSTGHPSALSSTRCILQPASSHHKPVAHSVQIETSRFGCYRFIDAIMIYHIMLHLSIHWSTGLSFEVRPARLGAALILIVCCPAGYHHLNLCVIVPWHSSASRSHLPSSVCTSNCPRVKWYVGRKISVYDSSVAGFLAEDVILNSTFLRSKPKESTSP